MPADLRMSMGVTTAFARAGFGVLTAIALTMPATDTLALPAEVFLMRHGHKDRQRGDFNLSPRGLARMQALARAIPACFGAVQQIVVYPFDRASGKNARSYQSAVPLAAATGVRIVIAETAPEQSALVGQALLSDPAVEGARVVMIWEHRHLPELASGLGWSAMPPIDDQDFDRLEHLRYQNGTPIPGVEQRSQAALLAMACAHRAPVTSGQARLGRSEASGSQPSP